jgi:hypothetical protein
MRKIIAFFAKYNHLPAINSGGFLLKVQDQKTIKEFLLNYYSQTIFLLFSNLPGEHPVY